MEIAVISDAITTIATSTQTLTFSNSLLNRPHALLSDQSPPSFHISAASPPTRTLTKRRIRKSRRVKRKIVIDNFGDGDEATGPFVFGDFGGFGGGYFGNGGGGGGGYGGGGGNDNWEEFSDNSISDPAFDFVYEVLCWIAMSNCLHFAFKKVVKLVGDHGKGTMQMPDPVC